jgi:hypothetical protein
VTAPANVTDRTQQRPTGSVVGFLPSIDSFLAAVFPTYTHHFVDQCFLILEIISRYEDGAVLQPDVAHPAVHRIDLQFVRAHWPFTRVPKENIIVILFVSWSIEPLPFSVVSPASVEVTFGIEPAMCPTPTS